jgi:hypothetical protein
MRFHSPRFADLWGLVVIRTTLTSAPLGHGGFVACLRGIIGGGLTQGCCYGHKDSLASQTTSPTPSYRPLVRRELMAPES